MNANASSMRARYSMRIELYSANSRIESFTQEETSEKCRLAALFFDIFVAFFDIYQPFRRQYRKYEYYSIA